MMLPEHTYPLSLVENRMLALNQQRPDADILSRPLKIFGDFCVETFSEAYKWLTEKYPILKTRYTVDEQTGTYVKVLDRPAVISFEDCTSLGQEYINRKLIELSSTVFDVQTDSLFNMHILKTAENEHIFYIKCHHICSDGLTCLKMLQNNFEAYYAHKSTGNFPCSIADYSLPDYIQFEDEFSNTKKGQTSRKYWSSILSEQKTSNETKNVPTSIQSHDVEIDIQDDEYALINEQIARMNVSTFAYAVAGLQESLPADSLISTTVSTRIQKKHRQEYGAMFNYALLSQGAKNESYEERAERLRKELFKAQRTPYYCETIGMHGNPAYPFDYKKTVLANYFKIASDSAGLGAMAFGSGDSSQPTPISPELSVKTLDAPMRFVPYSLYLSIGDFESRLNLKLIYNIELYTEKESLDILDRLKSKLLAPDFTNTIQRAE